MTFGFQFHLKTISNIAVLIFTLILLNSDFDNNIFWRFANYWCTCEWKHNSPVWVLICLPIPGKIKFKMGMEVMNVLCLLPVWFAEGSFRINRSFPTLLEISSIGNCVLHITFIPKFEDWMEYFHRKGCPFWQSVL